MTILTVHSMSLESRAAVQTNSTATPSAPLSTKLSPDIFSDISHDSRQSYRKNEAVSVVAILSFGAMYVYGMLDQASSNVLSTFEYYLFAALIPTLLIATSAINVYGLWRSRRHTPL